MDYQLKTLDMKRLEKAQEWMQRQHGKLEGRGKEECSGFYMLKLTREGDGKLCDHVYIYKYVYRDELMK